MVGAYTLLVACADLHPPPALESGTESGASAAGAAGGSGGGAAVASGGSGAGYGSPSHAGYAGGEPTGGTWASGGSSSGATTGGVAIGGAPAGSGGAALGAGTAGAGGVEAGAGGEAGTGGTSSSAGCERASGGDVRAWLFHELPSLASSELHPFLALTTSGPDIPLKQLSMRYFFTGEGSGAWQTQCVWVTQDGGYGNGLCDHGVSVDIVELNPPLSGADRYLEVSFPGVGTEVLSNLVPPVVEARTRLWRNGHPTLNQSNDYSFTPTHSSVLNVEGKAFELTARVAVYRNGTLIWGEEPCPQPSQ